MSHNCNGIICQDCWRWFQTSQAAQNHNCSPRLYAEHTAYEKKLAEEAHYG